MLGEVVNTTKMGYVIARIMDPNIRIRLGSSVVDDNGRELGKLVDVIGNIEKPYAVIRIKGEPPQIGGKVYMIPQRSRRRGRKKRRGVKGSVRGRLQTRGHHSHNRGPKSMQIQWNSDKRGKPR